MRLRLEKEGKVKPGLTPHGLRDSVATDLRELGKTAREIADIRACRHRAAVVLSAVGCDWRTRGAAMAEAHMSALAVILHPGACAASAGPCGSSARASKRTSRAYGRPPFTPAESA